MQISKQEVLEKKLISLVSSYGPHFNIYTVKKSCKNFNEMCKRSVVATFNSAQAKCGKGTCSSASAATWLKQCRPKHGVSPQRLDYCDTCIEYKEQAKRFRQVANRLLESGSAIEEEVEGNYALARSYDVLLKEHKEVAQKVLDHYRSIVKECLESWKTITELSTQDQATLTDDEVQHLAALKRNFCAVLSFDYQQNKNLPYWGYSDQPGETYYKMKLTCNVFGIVDHRNSGRDFNSVCICDEQAAGAKSADMTISFLDRYIQWLPIWINGLTLVADNAGTNKNYYLLAWAKELVRRKKFTQVWILFLVPGHSKFAPDALFAKIGNTFNTHDFFTIQELASIVERYAMCTIFTNSSIFAWKNHLSRKYQQFKGIKSYKDFRIKLSVFQKPVLMYHEHQYAGSYSIALRMKEEESVDLSPEPEQCYALQRISSEKLTHLKEMYDQYIPIDRRLSFLPPPLQPPATVSTAVSSTALDPTSEAARLHQVTLRKNDPSSDISPQCCPSLLL